jgi:hypothetical protein
MNVYHTIIANLESATEEFSVVQKAGIRSVTRMFYKKPFLFYLSFINYDSICPHLKMKFLRLFTKGMHHPSAHLDRK